MRQNLLNERSELISKLTDDQKFRSAYVRSKIGVLVPAQIRGLRLKSTNPPMPRQVDFANAMGTQQSRVSMFESPGANLTMDTLADVASTLRCGLQIRFVEFSKMLQWENEFSQDEFNVIRLDQDTAFLNPTPPMHIEQFTGRTRVSTPEAKEAQAQCAMACNQSFSLFSSLFDDAAKEADEESKRQEQFKRKESKYSLAAVGA